MAEYVYQKRSVADWERRQNASGFEGFIKDDYSVLRVKKGDNAIRIYPPTWKGANHYGYDVYVHYSVGPDNAAVICLQKMRQQPCPICEERMRVKRNGGDEEETRQLSPNKRVVCWAENKNDDKGLQIWPMPTTLDTEISKRSKDRETGKMRDVDSPTEGYTIYFDVEGEQRRTKYTAVELSTTPNKVPQKNIDYIIDNPIPETLRWRDYEEVLALFEGAAPRRRDDDRGGRSRDQDEDRRAPRDEDDRPARNTRSRDEDDDRPARSRDEDKPARSRGDDDDDKPARKREGREETEPPFETEKRTRPALRNRSAEGEEKSNGKDPEADERPARNTRSRDEDDDRPVRNTRSRDEDDDRPARRRDDDDRPSTNRGSDRAKQLSERYAKDD